MEPIRVMLADDHALFRQGLRRLLEDQPDFEVVGEAATGREAVERASEVMPDVILMDIYMPEGDGLEATRAIRVQLPYVRIVMLTVSDDDHNLFEAIKAGAVGYVLKKIDPQALYEKVRGAARGEAPLSPQMAPRLIAEFARLAAQGGGDHGDPLTPREHDVLAAVARGLSNKEIAAALGLSEYTVRNYLRNIMEKLHLRNRTEVATFAVRRGLAPSEES